MGPEYSKIAIGISAATGVVLVSFLLLKKFGYHDKSNTKEHKEGDGEKEDTSFEEQNETCGTTGLDSGEQQGFTDKNIGEVQVTNEDKNNLTSSVGELDGQNQQSFILIDEDDIPENNFEGDLSTSGKATKKSDRSSDESSYDVIENDRLDDHLEDVIGDVVGDDSSRLVLDTKTEDDVNMSSMVIIDDSKLGVHDPSVSSFFASVDDLNTDGVKALEKSENPEIPEVEVDKKSENLEVSLDTIQIEDVSENNSNFFSPGLDDAGAGVTTQFGNPFVDSLVSLESQVHEDILKSLDERSDEAADSIPADLIVQENNINAQIPVVPVVDTAPAEESKSHEEEEEENNTQNNQKTTVENIQKTTVENIQSASDALLACQNSPEKVTHDEILQLVELLSKNNPELQATVLNCLIKVTAFTQNINNLRESGCPEILVQQLRDLTSREDLDEKRLTATCNVLTNLTLDAKIKLQLGDLVPALTRVIQSQGASETVLLHALRPLVNLSFESVHHNLYRDLIPTLYSLLDSGSPTLKVLTVKVLVNLSQSDFVQDLLTAKAPSSLVTLLDPPSSDDLILRCLTMLSKMYEVICTTELNHGEKMTNPGTVFSTLSDKNNMTALRSKVLQLTRHDDEDLRYEASKVNNFLT
ncbi:hypothetical protein Btru_062058 [Bulinus truncatus]|nr:hypothetical protein Btru_062058 [Bulinus truncatus]